MLDNHSAYKYETPYNSPFLMTQCWANGTATSQCYATKIRHNICRIKPYTSDTNIEDINLETNDWWRYISKVLVICSCIILKLGTKYIIGCAQRPWR